MKNRLYYILNFLLCCLYLFIFKTTSFAEVIDDKNQNPFDVLHQQGDTLYIKLQDAIFTALERNPTVAIQRLVPQIAETYVDQQMSVYDPEISAAASKNRTKLQRFLGSRPDPFEMTTDRSQYDLLISENLPTGTTITAGSSMSGSVSSIYSDQFSGVVGLTVTQSLLQGFGIGVNLASLRQTKIDMEISKAELKAVAEMVTANIEFAYWNLYLANEETKIQLKSLQLAQKQLNESEERVAVGRLPELELAAVHAEVATRREALIDAQSSFEQARLQFLFLLNPANDKATWSTVPSPVDQPFIPADTLDTIIIHEQLAMKYRPDLSQARLFMKRGELDIVKTRNGLLPRLDIFVSFNRTSYAKTFKQALPDIHSPFYDINSGLSFTFPVLNKNTRAQLARAKYSQQQLEISLNNMERLVQQDVRSAYVEVLRSRQQIKASRVTHELQSKKLEAEQEKFRVGKSTNYLVLQAQRDFIESQLYEARSMVSYLNALVNLYLMEGTLLDRRGIHSILDE